jgi:hypothetical protein
MANGKKVDVLTRAQVRQLSVVQESFEILDWWYYDTITIAQGGTASVITFFQQSQGQGGLTKETTNMEIPSQLMSGYKLVAQKITCEPMPATYIGASTSFIDQYNVTHAGFAEFYIGGRNYMEVPIKNLLGGHFFGFSGGSQAGVTYGQSKTVLNGQMEYSPVIPATFNFGVRFTYPAAPTLTAAVKVRVQIVGKLIRPRQG